MLIECKQSYCKTCWRKDWCWSHKW